MALSEMSMVKTSFLRCFRKESTDIAVLFVFLLVPSSSPVNVTAVAHNSTTISVAWQPVPKEYRNGKIIAYLLITYTESLELEPYKVVQNFFNASRKHSNGTIISCRSYDNNVHGCGAYIKVDDGKEDQAQNVTISRLRKFTTYRIEVKAETSAGPSMHSESIQVRTSEAGK